MGVSIDVIMDRYNGVMMAVMDRTGGGVTCSILRSSSAALDGRFGTVALESAHLLLRSQHLEGTSEVLLNSHHSSTVIELPAVIGCGEDSHKLLLGEELIAVLDYLMGTADQVQLVLPQEGRDDLLSKDKAHSSFRLTPHLHAGFRVRPQQVAQQSGIRYIGGSDDGVDLFDGGEVGRESAVHAEDAVLDERGHGHAVEAVDEAFPQFDVVATLACMGGCVHYS